MSQIVPKHALRVEGFDETIISQCAEKLTTGENQTHLHDGGRTTALGAELARRFGTQNARPATGQGRSPDPIVI